MIDQGIDQLIAKHNPSAHKGKQLKGTVITKKKKEKKMVTAPSAPAVDLIKGGDMMDLLETES